MGFQFFTLALCMGKQLIWDESDIQQGRKGVGPRTKRLVNGSFHANSTNGPHMIDSENSQKNHTSSSTRKTVVF